MHVCICMHPVWLPACQVQQLPLLLPALVKAELCICIRSKDGGLSAFQPLQPSPKLLHAPNPCSSLIMHAANGRGCGVLHACSTTGLCS